MQGGSDHPCNSFFSKMRRHRKLHEGKMLITKDTQKSHCHQDDFPVGRKCNFDWFFQKI